MDLILNQNKVHFIRDDKDLAAAVRTLSNAKEIAIDTESDSLFVYYEKVCMIQLSADRQNYVIDPLETGDLSSLGPLFANPRILKIFHAAEYDIMCLKRDYGFSFANLFDTMLAARLLRKKEIGLGNLLANEFGIHLDKKYQKANWGLRPLSEEMLRYAAHDTIYLGMLKDKLEEELLEEEMLELAREDFERECAIPAGPGEPPVTNWWRIAGSEQLTGNQKCVLSRLCEYREDAARVRDLPPYKIAPNSALLAIALKFPQSLRDLKSIKGIGPAFVSRYGKEVLSLVAENRKKRMYPTPPTIQRPSNGILKRKERLRAWRRDKGIELDLPSDEILPKDVLERLCINGADSMDALREQLYDCPVRFALFGEELLAQTE